jgi:ketosteroid isomerase-like protein
MSQLNLDVVRSLYAAFDARDINAVLPHLDHEIEVVASEGLPWSGTYRGRDGFHDFVRKVAEHIVVTVDVEEMYSSGESVAQIGRLVGTVQATGAEFEQRVIHIWGMRDGRVVSFRNYVDTDEQRRILGLPAAGDDDGPPDALAPGNRTPFWS